MSVIQAGNTTSTSLIYTGDTTGNLVFTTGGANTVALTLSNAQAVTFANTASFTPGINGIIFNNSSALANSTLNDYETGSWTPTVTASSGTITTVGATVGQYTKVGNLVTLNLSATITTNGTGAGQVLISNLPFTMNTSITTFGVGREQLVVGFGIFGYLNSGDNKIYLQKYDGAYPGGSGYGLGFTITYRATF